MPEVTSEETTTPSQHTRVVIALDCGPCGARKILIDEPSDKYVCKGGVGTMNTWIADFDAVHKACHTFVGRLPEDAPMSAARAQLHLLCDRLQKPLAVMPGHEGCKHLIVFEDGNVLLTLADVVDLLKAGHYLLPVIISTKGVFQVSARTLVDYLASVGHGG